MKLFIIGNSLLFLRSLNVLFRAFLTIEMSNYEVTTIICLSFLLFSLDVIKYLLSAFCRDNSIQAQITTEYLLPFVLITLSVKNKMNKKLSACHILSRQYDIILGIIKWFVLWTRNVSYLLLWHEINWYFYISMSICTIY